MTTFVSHRTLSESQSFWRALETALDRIAQTAGARDRQVPPRFPDDAFGLLREAGALGFNAHPGERRPPADLELSLVRRVAAADGSVGRIFDGHLNAVERLAVQAPAELRDAELEAVCDGRLLAGVWGGDPTPDDGPPAAIVPAPEGAGTSEAIRGVKTFCSGAGGLDRAAVLVRPRPSGSGTPNGSGTPSGPDAPSGPGAPAGPGTRTGPGTPSDPPVLVWIDLADPGVEIDRTWYRAAGLVASESHRVIFHDVPVLARLGGPGAIAAQPWFARDALRTAASWAGMADTAVRGALTALARRPHRGELESLAAGRILTAQRTIDAWMSAAAGAIDGGDPNLAAIAVHARAAIADACRALLHEAAQACGSLPFARGTELDRARRDLELFLLQHRLDPLLARVGGAALERADALESA